MFGLAAVSFPLSLPLFAPWSWWPFGFVVFVPWLVAICTSRRGGWAHFVSYLLGAAFFLFHFHWLEATTPEGYVAASLLYLAPFFLLASWLIRHTYRRRGVPLFIAFPVIWTGIEILRTYNPLGFPWFLLGHSQIRLLPMVQVADVAGVYGVSFLVAMVNGWLAGLILQPIRMAGPKGGMLRPQTRVATAVTLLAVAINLAYGVWRLRQEVVESGPKVAVLQGDFLLRAVRDDPGAATDKAKERAYLGLMNEALAAHPDTDLVALPETPYGMWLNREFRACYPQYSYWHNQWVRRSAQTGKPIVVGALSEEPQPPGTYPKEHKYNSAFLYTPGVPEPQRYDKIHLVPFGEYVPFRYSRHFRWIYNFVAFGPFNPWGRDGYEYSLTAGKEYTVFTFMAAEPHRDAPSAAPSTAPAGSDARTYRFGVTICYEDVIPQVFRKFVAEPGRKRVDFMLNISNDGWFGHGHQQSQHLVNCAFRAIENRVGVARAVNTGISGFIDPSGAWRDLVGGQAHGLQAGGTGYSVARLMVDPRVTFYSLHGDVFGFLCGLAAAVCGADAGALGWQARRRRRRERRQAGRVARATSMEARK